MRAHATKVGVDDVVVAGTRYSRRQCLGDKLDLLVVVRGVAVQVDLAGSVGCTPGIAVAI